MKEIIFATNNAHKLSEVRHILAQQYHVVSPADKGWLHDIPEPYDTFEENALTKAQTIAHELQMDCFAEDTGLVVPALGGEPGVKSARYAGENRQADANTQLLLHNLRHATDRSAYFKTVVALVWQGQHYFFEGVIWGEIIAQPRGVAGFGYDPIFVPKDYHQTFAEMPATLKNRISHRAQAIERLLHFLQNIPT